MVRETLTAFKLFLRGLAARETQILPRVVGIQHTYLEIAVHFSEIVKLQSGKMSVL